MSSFSYLAVVLPMIFLFSTYVYIVMLLELAGIQTTLTENIVIFLNSILIPPSIVAFFLCFISSLSYCSQITQSVMCLPA